MSQKRVGSLEIGQDLVFQRKMWTIQRVAWVVMALIILAALLGLFATGPLSSASAETDAGGLRIEYGRFARHEALTTIQLEIAPEAVQNGEIRIKADQSLLDTYQIEMITPEPERVDLAGDGVIWTFTVDELTAIGQISLRGRPESFGLRRGAIGLAGAEMLTIRQVIYP